MRVEPAFSKRGTALLRLPARMQKTILEGVAAWRHGPLADDVSLIIVEVR